MYGRFICLLLLCAFTACLFVCRLIQHECMYWGLIQHVCLHCRYMQHPLCIVGVTQHIGLYHKWIYPACLCYRRTQVFSMVISYTCSLASCPLTSHLLACRFIDDVCWLLLAHTTCLYAAIYKLVGHVCLYCWLKQLVCFCCIFMQTVCIAYVMPACGADFLKVSHCVEESQTWLFI